MMPSESTMGLLFNGADFVRTQFFPFQEQKSILWKEFVIGDCGCRDGFYYYLQVLIHVRIKWNKRLTKVELRVSAVLFASRLVCYIYRPVMKTKKSVILLG